MSKRIRFPIITVAIILTVLSCETNKETKIVEGINGKGGLISNLKSVCSINSTTIEEEIEIFQPNERELFELKTILNYQGLSENSINFFKSDIQYAFAVVIDNKRYIIYNDDYFKDIDKNTESYWNSLFVIAHEVGHHLIGHTLTDKKSSNESELEADKFAGNLLYKMGASIESSTSFIDKYATTDKSKSHPNKDDRIKAVELGWHEAESMIGNSAIPPPPNNSISNLMIFHPENLIAGYQDYRGWASNFCEGIVLNKKLNDKYLVYITKANDNDFFKNFESVWIHLLDPYIADKFASNASLPDIDAILLPGQRIKFKYHAEGSLVFKYFSYLEALQPLENQQRLFIQKPPLREPNIAALLSGFNEAMEEYESYHGSQVPSDELITVNLKKENYTRQEGIKLSENEKDLMKSKTFTVHDLHLSEVGNVDIYLTGKNIELSAYQNGEFKDSYAKMKGNVEVLDSKNFKLHGMIEMKQYTLSGPELQDTVIEDNKRINGTFLFRKTGSRKYWRLKQEGASGFFQSMNYFDIHSK